MTNFVIPFPMDPSVQSAGFTWNKPLRADEIDELQTPDVVIIGAGIMGAACALSATKMGLKVAIFDRSSILSGTTSAGEGNVLVSDKAPGPELTLALRSLRLWDELARDLTELTGLPDGGFELEHKGGLVVADSGPERAALEGFAARQRAAGVQAEAVDADRLTQLEPHLAGDLSGGVRYPQDAQVQPMLATARMLADARRRGAQLFTGIEVTGLLRAGDRVTGIRTDRGALAAGAVVNAAGTWAGGVAALARVSLPIQPRRGIVLVTQPLPPLIRHKVYAAAYVADVASDRAGLESSAVIEGTPAGTVLIGASRERVGFDPRMPVPVIRRLARQAVRMFPVLAEARLLRSYRGYRPYCPDHLPVIGADPRAPGLLHACGHEGSGIGLAPATGELLAQLLVGDTPRLDPRPFRPERFDQEAG